MLYFDKIRLFYVEGETIKDPQLGGDENNYEEEFCYKTLLPRVILEVAKSNLGF